MLDLVICPEVLTDVAWGEFFIEEVAEITSGKDIYERERISGNTPYITATAHNNGIGYFVGNENKTKVIVTEATRRALARQTGFTPQADERPP